MSSKLLDKTEMFFWEASLLRTRRRSDGSSRFDIALSEKVHRCKLAGLVCSEDDDVSIESIYQDDFCLPESMQRGLFVRLFPYLLSQTWDTDGVIVHLDLPSLLHRKYSDPAEAKRVIRLMETAIRTFA